MRDHVTTLYTFEELTTDKAKDRARDWYREHVFEDSSDWEFVYEDAEKIAALFGLEIKHSQERGHIIASKERPARDFVRDRTHIFFTGFWSQGDGAHFEGRYEYKADALAAVKEYAPQDEKLHAIVADIQAAQDALKAADNYTLVADCTSNRSARYSHSGCMDVTFDATDYPEDRIDSEATLQAEHAVKDGLRAFADWIYKQLESEYEYRSSNEAIDESLIANEYEFTADGKRCTC